MTRAPSLDAVSLAVIAVGSAIGGALRIQAEAQAMVWLGWPAAASIAAINLSGGLLMGWLHQTTLPAGRWPLNSYWRQAILTGVLGGFTTFSVLSALTLQQFLEGALVAGMLNMFGSLTLAVAGAGVGMYLGGAFSRKCDRPA